MNRLDTYIKQIRGISYNPKDISEMPFEDYLPILKANNIKENGIDTTSLIYIHKSKIKKEQLIKKGDLLLAASSGSKDIVGKNIFFENDFNGSFGAFCKVVRPNHNINPRFLSFFFKTPAYKRHIRSLIQGANINNLRSEDIDSLKIPEFSQLEQIHIANILSQAENLIAQRKESIRLLDEYLKSMFLEMFGDPVRNEKGLKKMELGKLGNWKSGGTPLRAKKEYFAGNIPWLTSGELNEMFISGSKERITHDAILNSNASEIPVGSILLGMYDTAALKSSITLEISTCNQAIAFAKLDEKLCNTIYVYYSIQIGKEYFRSQQRGVRQKNMNLSMIKATKIPLPQLELQSQFAQIVEKIEAIKTQYRQSLQELEHLYGSLSQQAFKGELRAKDGEMMMAAEAKVTYQNKTNS